MRGKTPKSLKDRSSFVLRPLREGWFRGVLCSGRVIAVRLQVSDSRTFFVVPSYLLDSLKGNYEYKSALEELGSVIAKRKRSDILVISSDVSADSRTSATMYRVGNAAGNSGPTGFLAAGKKRAPGYDDAFLVRHGAAPGSLLHMTPNGFMTEVAWLELTKGQGIGIRKMPVICENPLWWVVVIVGGFDAHVSSPGALPDLLRQQDHARQRGGRHEPRLPGVRPGDRQEGQGHHAQLARPPPRRGGGEQGLHRPMGPRQRRPRRRAQLPARGLDRLLREGKPRLAHARRVPGLDLAHRALHAGWPVVQARRAGR